MIASSEKGKRRMVEAGITPSQCRAARAALRWSQDDLAERARVSRTTLVKFENETGVPSTNNMIAIRLALETANVRLVVPVDGERIEVSFPKDLG